MALIAGLDGRRLDASSMSDSEWSALKESQDRRRLEMPVCGIRAVAKNFGATQFFSHWRTAGCAVDHGGETPQHLAMKNALEAAINASSGWHACKEHPHPAREWIIDVLAERDDYKHRVAFEVQLSGQTPDEYLRRSQRYYDDNVIPVWVVPRPLNLYPMSVPIIVTRFGKSSELPAKHVSLLDLPVYASGIHLRAQTLGDCVAELLQHGPHGSAGSPRQQQAKLDAEKARQTLQNRKLEQQAKNAQESFERTVEQAKSTEDLFGAHTIHAQSGPFVWATTTTCWKTNCGKRMLVWAAVSLRGDEQQVTAGPPMVRSDVGLKRYENHPEVHRVVDGWVKAAKCSVPKASIKVKDSRAKGSAYSAFVCPACDATNGQAFLAGLPTAKWSLIGAPLLKKEHRTDRAAPSAHSGSNRSGNARRQ